MSSQLVFRPLSEDEFRILTLLPATSLSAPLRFQIFHTKLCIPQVPYAALSYTWTSRSDGNDHSSGELYELVDVDGNKTFLCHNLAMALHSVRLEVSRCLWVYALCIGQSNTAERNIQVVRMRNIFSNATNVSA